MASKRSLRWWVVGIGLLLVVHGGGLLLLCVMGIFRPTNVFDRSDLPLVMRILAILFAAGVGSVTLRAGIVLLLKRERIFD